MKRKSSPAARTASGVRLRADLAPTPNSHHSHSSAAPIKIALYSHDAMGVGHVRRNLLMAQSLSRAPIHATSLLICGVHEATAFTNGSGVDCLTLPSFTKHANDDYRPRGLRLPSDLVSDIRAQTLRSALLTMAPDLMIVDKVPKGLHGELEMVLPLLREQGTRIVFGLRDILDTPARVAREWRGHGYVEYIRETYDEIWVYGDPAVFDPISAYGWPELQQLVRYTGYFDQQERLKFAPAAHVAWRDSLGDLSQTVLCMVGGGQDGGELARAFVGAELPSGMRGLLVTGPLMDAREHGELKMAAASRSDMRVLRHVPDADLLVPDVARVICMGGYNSMLSVVSFDKPALIVPRVYPRQEQKIRAERFQQRGWLDWLAPTELCPESLTQWLQDGPHGDRRKGATVERPKLDGLQTIPTLLASLLSRPDLLAAADASEALSPAHQAG